MEELFGNVGVTHVHVQPTFIVRPCYVLLYMLGNPGENITAELNLNKENSQLIHITTVG